MALAALVLFAGCERTPRRFLVVVVDTLRADAVGPQADGRSRTPVMDGLAGRGARWTAARSPAPWTLPAMRAMLSGAWPDAPEAQAPDLGLRLAAAGWTPLAVTTNPWLGTAQGFGAGFAVWDNVEGQDAADQVQRAVALLDAHRQADIFLLVHFIDPHLPWKEPAHLRLPPTDRPPVDLGDPLTAQRLRAATPRDPRGRHALAAWARRRYLQNVAEVDEAIGVLLTHVGPAATVVVVADHGEEHLDHGGWDHGRTLYEEQLRVPLIAAGPPIRPGVHTRPVSTRALAATIAGWAGATPPAGPSLDDPPPDAGLPAGWAYGAPSAWGLLRGTTKTWVQGTQAWSTDLAADPEERAPATARAVDPAFAAALGAALGRESGAALRIGRDSGVGPADGAPWVLRCAAPIGDLLAPTPPGTPARLPTPADRAVHFTAGEPPLAAEVLVWPDPSPCAWEPGAAPPGPVDLRSVSVPAPAGDAVPAVPPASEALEALGYVDPPTAGQLSADRRAAEGAANPAQAP